MKSNRADIFYIFPKGFILNISKVIQYFSYIFSFFLIKDFEKFPILKCFGQIIQISNTIGHL